MATIIPIADLRRSPASALVEGDGEAPLSIFLTEFARGQGPSLHVHPYPEVFVVESGTAAFTVGDEELIVAGGHIMVVPAETPHGFKGAGDDVLRTVGVHPSGKVDQTWL